MKLCTCDQNKVCKGILIKGFHFKIKYKDFEMILKRLVCHGIVLVIQRLKDVIFVIF